MKLWQLVDVDGVVCLEYDGYSVSVEDLLNRPGFFVTHVAEKAWATREVVADLVDAIVGEASDF